MLFLPSCKSMHTGFSTGTLSRLLQSMLMSSGSMKSTEKGLSVGEIRLEGQVNDAE